MRFAVRSTVVAAFLVLMAATLPAQGTVQLGGAGRLTFKGFVSFTGFAQDQNFNFGNGQNAEYPVAPDCTVDCWFGGGDVRNTRLTMMWPSGNGESKTTRRVAVDAAAELVAAVAGAGAGAVCAAVLGAGAAVAAGAGALYVARQRHVT